MYHIFLVDLICYTLRVGLVQTEPVGVLAATRAWPFLGEGHPPKQVSVFLLNFLHIF